MNEVFAEKEYMFVHVDGLTKEEVIWVMQTILYEDCMMVQRQSQLLEDEEYAKSLQERFDAELVPGAASLSLNENSSESEGCANRGSYFRNFPFELDESYTPYRGRSISSTSSTSSFDHAENDRDYDPTTYFEYEEIIYQTSDQEDLHAMASTELIDLLPTRSYSSSTCTQLELTSDNKSCLICLLEWETGDCIKCLPCFHDFHSDCIDKWLMIKATCPVCRHNIMTED